MCLFVTFLNVTISAEEQYVVAKYDYAAQGSQELDLRKGDKLLLIDDSKHWWKVQNARGQAGFVPSNYVKREKPSLFDSIRRRVAKDKEAGKDGKDSTGQHRERSAARQARPSPPGTAHGPSGPPGPHGAPHQLISLEDTKPVGYATVRYNYEAKQADEISLIKGGRVAVLEKSSDGWWRGEHQGRLGWFPSNYVNPAGAEESSAGGHAGSQPRSKTATLEAPYVNLAGQEDGYVNVAQVGVSSAPILDVVIALYSFEAQNEEELSFSKAERLHIVDKPADDPDWWMAVNSTGQSGLVPKNYVQVEQTKNGTGGQLLPDIQQPWYYGQITRSECDQLLSQFGVDGDFLVRVSETNVGDLSVSMKAPGRNKHFKVHVEGSTYRIGQRKFNTLTDLVEHYKKSPIYTSPQGDKLYLVKAFKRP
ncbi:cytoplasmic protein NCK1-like isoform X2 [Varroa jacobsoni]|uniref:cytoplasmic protein NCK1-like isoform X2 n=1 Tax=Varroa jacobsoni TaxID=62625 RepID=UPI000BFAAF75|nr:cytoplasmic protein NCK1-like isoform X2 [Varroa jacobsoni]